MTTAEDFIHAVYQQIAKGRETASRPIEPYAEWRANVQVKADAAKALCHGSSKRAGFLP